MTKSVVQRMPEPFSHIEIRVNPSTTIQRGQPDRHGHSIGIMNTALGEGTRGSLLYAEAEAKAVLKAIRAYRRKNPDEFPTPSTERSTTP